MTTNMGKPAHKVNQANADRLWKVLKEFRGYPLTKDELIDYAEFTDPNAVGREELFKYAIKRCRKRAEKEGLIIPMSTPYEGYTYQLTSDPNAVVPAFFHSSRVSYGFKTLHDKHQDFIARNSDNLPPVQRRLFSEILDSQQRQTALENEARERNETLMRDLSELMKEELAEREV